MIQAGRRKFQQSLSCFKCNWKKMGMENTENGILQPCWIIIIWNRSFYAAVNTNFIVNSDYKFSDIFRRDVSFLFSFCQSSSQPLWLKLKPYQTFLIWIWSRGQKWSLHINKRKKNLWLEKCLCSVLKRYLSGVELEDLNRIYFWLYTPPC